MKKIPKQEYTAEFKEVKAAYGSRRMHRELQGRGHRIGLRRVERLMRRTERGQAI